MIQAILISSFSFQSRHLTTVFFTANRAVNVKACGLGFAGILIYSAMGSIELQTIQSPKFKAQVRFMHFKYFSRDDSVHLVFWL